MLSGSGVVAVSGLSPEGSGDLVRRLCISLHE